MKPSLESWAVAFATGFLMGACAGLTGCAHPSATHVSPEQSAVLATYKVGPLPPVVIGNVPELAPTRPGQSITYVMTVCVDDRGRVQGVEPIGDAGGDQQDVIDAVAEWRFEAGHPATCGLVHIAVQGHGVTASL